MVITYGEYFKQAFPYFLAIGMTAEEYWEGDPRLAQAFYKAHKLKITMTNQQLWLQGLYIYRAVDVVVGNALRKKGTPASKYIEQPIKLFKTEEEITEEKVLEERKKAVNAFEAIRKAWVAKHHASD